MKRRRELPAGTAASRSGSPLVSLAAFTLLSLLLYANTLGNAFVHDDRPLVAENFLIRDLGNLGRIFSSGYWTTGEQAVPELYRPVTVTSFALNFLLCGASPPGYHLVNLLLHAWVSWLVYRLALSLSGGEAAAWAGGLLFAVHPVHTEAVAEVVGRSEALSAGFFLSALLLDRAAAKRTGAALCYLAAMLSKENAVILPGVLLLTDWAFPAAGRRRSRYAVYLATALLYLAARALVLGSVARTFTRPIDNPILSADRWTGFLTALLTAGKYVGLLFWPFHLSADYSSAQIPLATGARDPRVLLSLALLAAGAALALAAWRRSRLASWSVLFYGLTILPVSNLLIPIGTIFAERLLYLPSVGFCLAAGAAFATLHRRRVVASSLLLGSVLLAGSLRTVARNRIWRDEGTFARATATDAPGSAKAQHNLGAYLEDHGDLAGAEAAYRRASELAPEWADTYSNRAGVLLRLGRVDEAIQQYRSAIGLRPDVLRYRVNLGYALYRGGRHQEAIALYREALRVFGDSAPLFTNLGANMMALQRYQEAVDAYRSALRLDPSNPDYFLNLGQALAKAGETRRSVEALRKGASLRPGSASLQAALGEVLLENGKPGEAAFRFRLASSIDPRNAYYHYDLARALEAKGESDPAIAEYRTALTLSPDAVPALRDLGLLLARRGERGEAARLLSRANVLTPGGLDPAAREILSHLE